jgi:hypothetical protein
MISIGSFVRRVNRDSTIDLICIHCFQTAASGKSDAEVNDAAQQHACVSLEEIAFRAFDFRGTTASPEL